MILLAIDYIAINDILKALLALSLITISSNFIAHYLTRYHLPLITGFIVIGVIAGRYILKMLPENIDDIDFIEEIALGFIAFAAGTELYLKEIRDRIRSITIMTISQFVVIFIVGAILLWIFSPYIPILNVSSNIRIAVILLISTIFIASSPASAIAVINELRAKGPYTKTAIGVTVLKDIFVMMLFTLTFGFAQSLISGASITYFQIFYILMALILTILMGLLYGYLLKLLFKANIAFFIELVLLLLLGWSLFIVSDYFNTFVHKHWEINMHIEPLFAGVVASFYITNFTPYRINLQKLIERSSDYVYVIFFTFIGATLAVNKLISSIGIILLVFFIRLIAIFIASTLGSLVNKENWKHVLLSWTPYISQAGVSLGLIAVVASEFSEFGSTFETLLVSVIIINQFVGPPLMKWAIIKAAEAHTKAKSPHIDTKQDVFIIGLEGKAIALAKALKKRDWNVKILTDRTDYDKNACKEIEIVQVPNWDYPTLKKVGLNYADSVVLLKDEETNLKLAELIYEKFGVPNVIVRIEDRSYIQRFRELDTIVVEPVSALTTLLAHFVVSPQATSILLGLEENQQTEDIEVLNRDVHAMALRDLRLPLGILVLYIKRNDQMMLAHGYTRLRLGDVLTVVGSPEQIEQVRNKLQ